MNRERILLLADVIEARTDIPFNMAVMADCMLGFIQHLGEFPATSARAFAAWADMSYEEAFALTITAKWWPHIDPIGNTLSAIPREAAVAHLRALACPRGWDKVET